ncbi:MAG: flagellar biosynthesis protein FlhB [Lachnospiraceae bacterium]|nr:flagellar biosynthesis protein FlhB [Lachnospiraceae bacterium]
MGGEKTEPATPKKLSDARNKGQVAKSREVANGLGMLALFLVLKFWVGSMGTKFLHLFSGVYNKIPETVKMYGGQVPANDILIILQDAVMRLMILVAPVFLVGFLVAFLSDYVQVKWKITTEPLKPKFSKLNPVNGMKRIFSIQSLVELIKSVAKIILVTYVAYSYLINEKENIFILYDIPLMQAIQLCGELVIELGIRISLVYMIIAVLDFAYQKYKFNKDMKMTKQEVKEEYKQSEGDPQVKGKIKQKMREASMRRMMQDLPKADVVITNPTHYAVAIKYDPDQYDAPIVLAKGEDYLAQKIKEKARENNIEIVENKPLARMLYANVEVGQAIPPELYQAVAEVLAFVYRLKGKV